MVETDQDPRIERSRRVILEAALEELGAVGYGALTIEAVAARAGVGKSTIYRHWSGKLGLVEDAFRTLKAQAVEVPTTGSLRDRVTGFLEQVATVVEHSTYSTCMPALIEAAERDPQVRAFHCQFSTERMAVLVDMLRNAIGTELPDDADPELLADALVGPIVMRRLMYFETFDPAKVSSLVDQVLPEPPARKTRRP